MDSCTLSLQSIELPAVLAISNTQTSNLVIINYYLSGKAKVLFFVAKHQSVSETESEENLERSQNKAENDSATWC